MGGLVRDVEALEPRTRYMVKCALEKIKAAGLSVYISETHRSVLTQKAYFAQGRESTAAVNAKRRDAGLWAISEGENRKVVTWTLDSRHLIGQAIDVVPALGNGQPRWNAPRADYEALAAYFKAEGLEWGGDWKGKEDLPHYQLRQS